MAVVDASIWVAFFNPDDKFHNRARDVIYRLAQEFQLLNLPTLAFIEVSGAVRRATGSEVDAHHAVNAMRKMMAEVWDVDSIRVGPVATSLAAELSCRGADACYIAVALLAKDTLWTFDKTQKECAKKTIAVAE